MIKLYDTTLRDGSQAEEICFSLEDKLRIVHKLDEFGIHYIEGGWPGANPRDSEFFLQVKKENFVNTKIVAFGSTRRAKNPAQKDINLKAIIKSGADAATIFGKTWKLHVQQALRISLEQNLELIFDSLSYLKSFFPEVFYDAEHFFDGYKDDPEYALKTLKTAEQAGVNEIILCDTNGGTMPFEIPPIIERIRQEIKVPLGIHAHNDTENAVANSLMAVHCGVSHVQGTINGYGERSGNANLCSVIPNLKLKLKLDCIQDKQLSRIKEVSDFVAELANLRPWVHQPYVGKSAFAHKGGVHVSAVNYDSRTYEHINPELVGNSQRVLISDLSGKSNVIYKAREFGVDLKKKEEVVEEVLNKLKDLETKGFQFEAAEGSFELLIRRATGSKKEFFKFIGFRLIIEKKKDEEDLVCEATLKLKIKGKVEHTVAEGNGPVNALDNALRKALETFYPEVKEVNLLDYKVRILDEHQGTSAKTRVLIESGDKKNKWGTVGVSENIIEASWQALMDSIEYKLHRIQEGESK